MGTSSSSHSMAFTSLHRDVSNMLFCESRYPELFCLDLQRWSCLSCFAGPRLYSLVHRRTIGEQGVDHVLWEIHLGRNRCCFKASPIATTLPASKGDTSSWTLLGPPAPRSSPNRKSFALPNYQTRLVHLEKVTDIALKGAQGSQEGNNSKSFLRNMRIAC